MRRDRSSLLIFSKLQFAESGLSSFVLHAGTCMGMLARWAASPLTQATTVFATALAVLFLLLVPAPEDQLLFPRLSMNAVPRSLLPNCDLLIRSTSAWCAAVAERDDLASPPPRPQPEQAPYLR